MGKGKKSAPAGRRGRIALPGQRGAALLVFMLLMVMGGLFYIFTGLPSDSTGARRTQQTQETLAQAREALVGHALRYREQQTAQGQPGRMYGYLPLPDLGSTRNNNVGCLQEGCDAANFAGNALGSTVIGRLPWRTLGIEPLRDSSGECLWYAVSGSHQREQRLSPMNWDALGHLDIVVANGTAALASALAGAHERPVAVIFSAGPPLPGQNRAPAGGDDVARCGGNYDVANYLDPAAAAALGGVTNYLAGTNKAYAVTDALVPKALTTRGRVFASGGNFLADACPGGDCSLLANDTGLALTGDALFGAIRKHAYFRTDINALLDRMVNCLRDQAIASGTAARIADNACYDSTQVPLGYYEHYKEMVFLARPSGPFTVNGDGSCAAALIFAGQRGAGQQRATVAQKLDFSNYLEGANLANFSAAGTVFSGPTTFERAPAQAPEQDIVRCVPGTPSVTPVTSPTLGANQLVGYDTATRTLTLGRQDVTTGWGYNANALFGCGWFSDVRAIGNGLRSYFNFQFMDAGGSVGLNGFVFALADAQNGRNTLNSCGAGGSHLGYSGDNGVTPRINYPKIGIEFDQSRQSGYSEFADLSLGNPGRNDPCLVSSCGAVPANPYPSHAAIVYWGHEIPNPVPDGVSRPNDDDNVHGYPTVGSIVGTRQPPRSHADHVTESGIKYVNLKGDPTNSRIYHVRVELTPILRTTNADASLSKTTINIEVWIDDDDDDIPSTLTSGEAALKDTTRPMSLYLLTAPTYSPTKLTQTVDLFDVQEPNACTFGASPDGCPAGQACGSDNMCYRPALEKIQLGFTGSQRTSDQLVNITDLFTTWLP
ncbi:MAG: hypothetical protein IPH73_10040 [Rhodocyclales bacterium]|nr:hypothetical protein [Rhodocyclales bacterium]